MQHKKTLVIKNMTTNSPQIVHESEAQRQFVRIQMPAKVEHNGKLHGIRDLSTGGIAILDVEGSVQKGAILPIKLLLPFQDFTLDINIDAQVQNYDEADRAIGARFTNLSKQQVSLLNHIIKSFIAGDVVESGDLLNVVARDSFVRVRKQVEEAPVAPNFARQALPIFIIALLGFAGALLIGRNVFESAFTVHSTNAVVEGDVIKISSASAGRFETALKPETIKVKTGETLGIVKDVNGTARTLSSPCDCYVLKAPSAKDIAVLANNDIITLAPVDSLPTVTVQLDTASVQSIKMASAVTISIAGDDADRAGVVVDITSSISESNQAQVATGAALQPYATIKIKAEQRIPVELIGRPAQVTFSTY